MTHETTGQAGDGGTTGTTDGASTRDGDAVARMAALAATVLAHPATQEDIDEVTGQLGRYPRGMLAVGARCVCGRPLAVVTRPMLPGNIPFPTTCYLTNPVAVKAVSHAEAAGTMAGLTERLGRDGELRDAYEAAHRDYLAFRHEIARLVGDDETHLEGVSAGGMPTRVKCLHALVAQSLVMGEGVNPVGDLTLAAIRDEFDPAVCRCAGDRADAGR